MRVLALFFFLHIKSWCRSTLHI